jgi:excisionase family DNA binding protein
MSFLYLPSRNRNEGRKRMKPLLSIKEASELTGLSVATLYKYKLLRTVPFVKIGRRLLFDEDRLVAWIDGHRSEPMMTNATTSGHGRAAENTGTGRTLPRGQTK